MKVLTLTFVIFLAILSGCTEIPEHDSVVEIDTGNDVISVYAEVVSEQEERSRGLMFREFLDENAGMLFVWEGPEDRSFWMKNTLIPLDMIFISEDLKVLNIEYAVPCEADPCAVYDSVGPAQYVLEVNGGFSEKHGIRAGSTIVIDPKS